MWISRFRSPSIKTLVAGAVVLLAPATAQANPIIHPIAFVWPAAWIILVPVVLIEAVVAVRVLGVTYGHGLGLSFGANLLSTALGVPIGTCFNPIPLLLILHDPPNPTIELLIMPSLLLPLYFLSVVTEAWAIRRFLDESRRQKAWRCAWLANGVTYGLIATGLTAFSLYDGLMAQERVIAAIEKLGGTVERENTPSRHAVRVRLLGDKITDEALELVQELADLRELDLAGTQLTNDGLAPLEGLRALQAISLVDTQVGDAGLVHLKGLKDLKRLDLAFTRVGDAGLEQLEGLKSLEFLDLAGTRVSDAGLVHLERLKNFRWLLIRSTGVTKAGVERLRWASPNLEVDDPVPVSRKR
jgi:hypothetical protein